MRGIPATHRVAVLVLEGVVPFDFAIPWQVLGGVKGVGLPKLYDVRACGPTREVDVGGFCIGLRHGLRELESADTIFVPGIYDFQRAVSPAILRALRAAAERGARIASICTGAFVLAQAGLLDGKRVTTHWKAAGLLAQQYPAVEVDPSVLYVDCGSVLTSAGVAAGLDLCLYMVRRDFGAAVAADVARVIVMPLERSGGQSQFVNHVPPAPDSGSLEPLLRWIEGNLAQPLTLHTIARRAKHSERTLSRRFREQTGTTPLVWLTHARVRRAQHLLETTHQSLDWIAAAVGFGSAGTLRAQFKRVVTISPREYRRAFRPGSL